jgi:hypothetical protein
MLEEYSTSPTTILLLITVIGISHLFHTDISQNFKKYLETNPLIKQIIIFLVIFTIISHMYKSEDFKTLIFISVIIYLLFLFTLKSNYKYQLAILSVLCLYSIYDNIIKNKEDKLKIDPQLNLDYKEKIFESHNKNRKIAYVGIAIFIIIGALYNEHTKQEQFKEQFNLIKFLFPK